MTFREYAKEVFLRIFIVTIVSLIAPSIIYCVMERSLLRLLVLSIVATICTGLSVLLLGLTENERIKIIAFAKAKMRLKQGIR